MLNPDIAYLLGMIVGKGQIVRGQQMTEVLIDIPHKNLTLENQNTQQSIKASLLDLIMRLRPLIGAELIVDADNPRITHLRFEKQNQDYLVRTINEYLQLQRNYRSFRIPKEMYDASPDIRREFLKGFCDVTAHIRKSNAAFGQSWGHRVYIEVVDNWEVVADVANLLETLDVPVQTIRWGHPNFVDPSQKYYRQGVHNYKEHQIKIWAEEFEKIGFTIEHKNQLLHTFAKINHEEHKKLGKSQTLSQEHHRYFWQTRDTAKKTAPHPDEHLASIPSSLRGRHFNSWKEIAIELGYGPK